MTHESGSLVERAARRLPAALALGLVAAPRAAHACYVCMSGRDDATVRAFMFGSVLLSVLPFALFGGIGVFLWRQLRNEAREEREARAARADLGGLAQGVASSNVSQRFGSPVSSPRRNQ